MELGFHTGIDLPANPSRQILIIIKTSGSITPGEVCENRMMLGVDYLISEAILAHGGDAQASRDQYAALTKGSRINKLQ